VEHQVIVDQDVVGRALRALRIVYPETTAHERADLIEKMDPREITELAAVSMSDGRVVFAEGSNLNGRVQHGPPPEGFKLEPAYAGRTVVSFDGAATNLEIRHGRNRPEEPTHALPAPPDLTEADLEPLFLARPAFPAVERTVCPACLEERHRTPLGGQVCLNDGCGRYEEVVK
jgi:hypothetical protein